MQIIQPTSDQALPGSPVTKSQGQVGLPIRKMWQGHVPKNFIAQKKPLKTKIAYKSK
jgi:hypothetical protein